MSGQPWETHDRLCPNRRPTVAFPNSACSGCRAVVAARAEGYARGLIEGDHGGRREGSAPGWLVEAEYARGQRDEREKWSVLIKDRIRDLQSCTKHDDCMGKADILLVILDDYDYADGDTR